MKKLMAVLCSTWVLLTCTACGESAKDGYSSKEKAAEAYYNLTNIGEISEWQRLIPDDCEKYIQEKCNLTEEQFKKKLDMYYQDDIEEVKNHKLKINDFKVTSSKEENDYSRLNNILNNYGLDKADEFYHLEVSFAIIVDGERKECKTSCETYKYKGKWYCHDAVKLTRHVFGDFTDDSYR